MQLFHLKPTVVLLCIALASGCANSPLEMRSIMDIRQPLAEKLEQEKRFADALNQWQIMAVVYPDDELINANIQRLNNFIGDQVNELRAISDRYAQENNAEKLQLTNLKILALRPTDQQAKKVLQDIEWENAYDSASEKTAAINEYFQQSQQKAKTSIRKSQYFSSADELLSAGKYQQLIELSQKHLLEQPNNETALKNIFEGFRALGDEELTNGDKEQAIAYFEQALDVNTAVSKKKLISQLKKIKHQLSDEYYRDGLKQFKNSIDDAIRLFEKSQQYNPENFKAVQQLQRAKTIQQNLQKIRAN